MSTDAAVWVGAILSLCAYSFLIFQDNPAFSLSEHLVVGCAAGYHIVVAVNNLKGLAFRPLADGQLLVIVPLLLGVLLYAKYVPRVSWLSRIPVSLLVGLASGVGARGAIQSQILDQLKATMVNLDSLSNVILFVGVVSVLWYFFLTIRPEGKASAGLARIGRLVMMAAFGAGFGSTVMGRFSILISHVRYLINTWLGIGA